MTGYLLVGGGLRRAGGFCPALYMEGTTAEQGSLYGALKLPLGAARRGGGGTPHALDHRSSRAAAAVTPPRRCGTHNMALHRALLAKTAAAPLLQKNGLPLAPLCPAQCWHIKSLGRAPELRNRPCLDVLLANV